MQEPKFGPTLSAAKSPGHCHRSALTGVSFGIPQSCNHRLFRSPHGRPRADLPRRSTGQYRSGTGDPYADSDSGSRELQRFCFCRGKSADDTVRSWWNLGEVSGLDLTHLGQPEVQHFDLAVGRNLHVRRHQIAIDYASFVSGFECFADPVFQSVGFTCVGGLVTMIRIVWTSPQESQNFNLLFQRRSLGCRSIVFLDGIKR